MRARSVGFLPDVGHANGVRQIRWSRGAGDLAYFLAAEGENHAGFVWEMKASDKNDLGATITTYQLTSVSFPEGSIIIDADKVFKYPTFMYGPWGFP